MVRTVLSNQFFDGDDMFSFQAKFKVNTFHIWFINCHELSKPTEQSCLNVCSVVLICIVLTKKEKKKNICQGTVFNTNIYYIFFYFHIHDSYMCLFVWIDIELKFKNKISLIVFSFLIQKIIDTWWFIWVYLSFTK